MTYLRYTCCPSLVLLLAFGCGEFHPATDVDAGPETSDAAAPGEDAGSPSLACRDLCQERRDADPSTGGCPFDTVPGSGTCEDRCGEVASMSTATRDAFAECVRNDPLCFQSIDQCVFTQRYPEPTPVPTMVIAEGFDAFEGRAVTVAIQAGAELFRRETTIVAGRFDVRFDDPLPLAWPPLALGFVDVDEDGACGPSADVEFAESLVQVGTFDAPAFELRLAGPPEGDRGFVCDEF